jgi:SAM-dependent methyltransferase
LTREQRLVFGEVAEDYHAARPGYPDALFDDVVAAAGGRSALEVGAGTGKATSALVARGLDVVALEPSAEMAAVLRRVVPGVRVELSDFEAFATHARFHVICAAQSWHWVDPERGFPHARSLLRAGGLLALFWNRPGPNDSAVQQELDEVYQRLTPELFRKGHVAERDFTEQIVASGVFHEVELREYPWTERRTTQDFVRLSGTHSDHRILPEALRVELLGAIAEVIDRHGGAYTVPWVAKLYLARAAV